MKRLLIFLLVLAPTLAGAASTTAQITEFAGKLAVLPMNPVIYGHYRLGGEDLEKTEPELRRFVEFSHSVRKKAAEAIPLLKDENPKVRALALCVLFDSEDVFFLPSMRELMEDDAETLPAVEESGKQALSFSEPRRTLRRQTVGDVARILVESRLRYTGGRQPQEIDAYLEERRTSDVTVGDWELRMERTAKGTRPVPKESEARMKGIWDEIRRQPEPRASWLMLWLGAMWHQEYGMIVDGRHPKSGPQVEEIVKAIQKLPRAELLDFLAGKPPAGDSDMNYKSGATWPYHRTMLFVLKNADRFFTKDDADALLKIERDVHAGKSDNPLLSGWWPVAAAKADPNRAAEILPMSMQRYGGEYDGDERGIIACGLRELAGPSQRPYLLEWFYNEPIEKGSYSHARAVFIEKAAAAGDGDTLCAIIWDPRFDTLDWRSLHELLDAAKKLSGRSILTEKEYSDVWHPLGEGGYEFSKKEAREKYPKETAALEQDLSLWRDRLRTWADQQGGGAKAESQAASE